MPHPNPDDLVNPEDAGRWEGDTFHFHEPLVTVRNDGVSVMKSITIPPEALGDGITRDDVVHALLNQVGPATAEPIDGNQP